MAVYEPYVKWKTSTVFFNSAYYKDNCLLYPYLPVIVQPNNRLYYQDMEYDRNRGKLLAIEEISTIATYALAARGYEVTTLQILPTDLDALLEVPLNLSVVSTLDYEKFINKTEENVLEKLPKEYYDLADAFSKEQSKKLLLYRPSIDYKIELKPGVELPHKRPYLLSKIEDEVVKKQVIDGLENGGMRNSNSLYVALVIVVRKPGGGLRVY